MLAQQKRAEMVSEIIEAMRNASREAGIQGDFGIGFLYLRNNATDSEVEDYYKKWVQKESQ